MADSSIPAASSSGPWRERRRILLAILTISLLYIAIQELQIRGASQLARYGWTVNDPARMFAAEAEEVAEQSRLREAALPADFPLQVFQLGIEYGYVNQWLGGYGNRSAEEMDWLSRPIGHRLQRLEQLARELSVAPAAPLPMRTAADFSQLTQRIEADEDGLAGRIEAAGSIRLRHLFLLGAHVATEIAALESARDLIPIPATQLIGQHATLAGISEDYWRPLGRYEGDTPAARSAAYQAAARRLEASLEELGNPEAPR